MPIEQVIRFNPHRKHFFYNLKPRLVPPQATLTTWVDMSAAKDFRNHFKGPIRLTYTHLFVKAAAMALQEQPRVNAVWTARGIVLCGDICIGVPVPVEGGFLPVGLKNPQSKSLSLIAQEFTQQAEELRSRPLKFGITTRLPQSIATWVIFCLKNYRPPIFRDKLTFMLSNFGQWGLDRIIGVITNYSAMVAPGRIADRVTAINGILEVRPTVSLTLAYDCRLIDDLQASQFLSRLKSLLENPQSLA
jgi:pyruvate dehydrogenase E2 component (dihydrolipoamide acetyltransferase)